jgi:hypothetical protein
MVFRCPFLVPSTLSPRPPANPRPRVEQNSPAGESLLRLLAELMHALLRSGFDHIPIAAINRIIAGCALIALVAPLLLWVSWSKTGFFIIIGMAAIAVGIIYLLVWLYPEDPF